MTVYIPYGRQDITDDDVAAVVDVLRSDWLTQGPCPVKFERTVADYCSVAHAVAVNSGTSALHIACLALGLGPGDTLWTSPNSFVASANCARYCGAEVDFVDIDERTRNMSAEALGEKLAAAEKTGKLPKIVVPVHYAGQSCDMRRIHALSQRYGFKIVEDAAHGIGGKYRGEPIGNCRYSDVVSFSFHPVKVVTTGEGGLLVTNDVALAEKMMRLRSHGITRDPHVMRRSGDGPWYYQMLELGWNYRLTDLQAALGVSQMTRLDDYIRRRTARADRYDAKLAGSGIGLPWRDPDCGSAWHLYSIDWDEERLGTSRKDAFIRLRAAEIGVNVHYIPIHLQPYYADLGFRAGQFPQAERHYAQAITVPLYPGLTDDDQDRVVDVLLSLRGT